MNINPEIIVHTKKIVTEGEERKERERTKILYKVLTFHIEFPIFKITNFHTFSFSP